MEDIKWLDVVLDYGKRFPDREVNELLPESTKECKFSSLINYASGAHSKYLHLTYKGVKHVFSTSLHNGEGILEYFHCKFGGWVKVSNHILLKLLTDGKEDLI